MEDGLLSLKWNNHRSTFFHILTSLREKGSYTDATLACEGEFFPVHKLIMSTCSDYFADMFDRTQCKSPIVVLKDIKKSDLSALLDYMYVGEVDVRQSDLAGLIKAAECLRIKGLAVPDEDPMKAAKKQVNVSGPRVPERSRSNSSPPPPSKRQKRESSNGPSSPPPIPPSTSDNRSTSVPSHVNSLPVIKGGFGEPPSPTRSDSAEVLPLDHIKVEHDDGGQNNSPSTQLDHRGDTSNELGDMGGGMGDSIGDSMSDFPQFNEQDIEKQEHDQLDYSDQLAGPSGLQSGAQSMGWNEGDDASFPHNLFGTDDPNQQQVKLHWSEMEKLKGEVNLSMLDQQLHSTSGLSNETFTKLNKSMKKYKCQFCAFESNYKNCVVIHERRHTGEKPFKCNMCDYSCTHSSALSKHIRTHLGERPYQCLFCQYSTSDPSNLKSHQRTHTVKCI